MLRFFSLSFCFLILLSLLVCPSFAEEADILSDTLYMENSYNFVDGSMDISKGIPEDAQGRLLEIRLRGQLTVATEPYFPPQEFLDPSKEGQEQFQGADMELARYIAEKMGVELVIVPLEFSDALEQVAEGTYDLAISGLAFTPARADMLTMSKGYHYPADPDTNGLMVRTSDLDSIQRISDLSSLNIAAQSGSLQETIGADNIFMYHEFIRYSSIQDVYDALTLGRADVAVVDLETAQDYIARNPACGLSILPFVRFSLAEQYLGDRVAAKKGEVELMYFVNGVIDELLESGAYETWFQTCADYAASLTR
ncbi:MAG: transporter substrate-binding domain-containing protein [Clostridia bacterium]|nr:transporter substrate-binding domain-containing protein [Clostridia bacterium]